MMNTRDPIPAEGHVRRIMKMRTTVHRLLDDVIDTGRYHQGIQCRNLEQKVAARWGGHWLGVSSGTAALGIATRVLGLAPGDEIIVPALTFVSTAFAPASHGVVPVSVDVDPNTRGIDPMAVEAAVTDKTRALLVVHMHGLMADMPALMALAGRYELAVIEDCAQAAGAICREQYAGTIGDLGCFSMWVGKNLGGLSDAGMLAARDPSVLPRLRMLSDLGRDGDRHTHRLRGERGRLSELDAAVIATQLDELPEWIARRREIATRYANAFRDLPLGLPDDAPGREHTYYKYPVTTNDSPAADALYKHLEASGIAPERIYPRTIAEQPAFATAEWEELPHRACRAPHAERFARTHVCLPIYPELADAEVDRVITVVRRHFATTRSARTSP